MASASTGRSVIEVGAKMSNLPEGNQPSSSLPQQVAEYWTRHNVTLPFTRMLLGPMDYTPGAMVNAGRESNFAPVFERPMSLGTRVHQLAMYVVYEGPLQMLADSPSHYLREPEVMEFLRPVPTVWDETRVLAAQLGDYVAIARRRGHDWYIGAMTDWTSRTLDIDFSFLPAGRFEMAAYEPRCYIHPRPAARSKVAAGKQFETRPGLVKWRRRLSSDV